MGTISNHAGLKPIPLTVDPKGAVQAASTSGAYAPASFAYDRLTPITGADLWEAYGTFGLQLSLQSTAAPTALSAQLQGSLDGLGWYNIGTALTGTANGTQFGSATDTPARYLRLNLTVTGGTNVAVSAWAGVSE